jgi:hypothetical protein
MILAVASAVSFALFPNVWRNAGLAILGLSLLAFWVSATINRMAIGVQEQRLDRDS